MNYSQPPSGGFSRPGLLGAGAFNPGRPLTQMPGSQSEAMGMGQMPSLGFGQMPPQGGFGQLPPQANPMAQQNAYGMNQGFGTLPPQANAQAQANAFGMNPMAQGQPHLMPPQGPMNGMRRNLGFGG